MDSHRPGVTSFVHIGLVVEDLDETVRFLALLGFDCGEPVSRTRSCSATSFGPEGLIVELAERLDGAPG